MSATNGTATRRADRRTVRPAARQTTARDEMARRVSGILARTLRDLAAITGDPTHDALFDSDPLLWEVVSAAETDVEGALIRLARDLATGDER